MPKEPGGRVSRLQSDFQTVDSGPRWPSTKTSQGWEAGGGGGGEAGGRGERSYFLTATEF